MNKDLVIRLSKYKRLLQKLKALGLERVFSNNLGDGIGVSPALVRKDFSVLNMTGNKRGGYGIHSLIERLDQVLGLDKPKNAIIAGCGNIGVALIKFEGFRTEGIKITGGFDIYPEKFDKTLHTPIMHIDEMKDFIIMNKIQVGILAVPDSVASEVFSQMVDAGIRGILNFTSVELKTGKDNACTVHNVNLGLELEHLFYQVNMNSISDIDTDK
ncbi:MAG: redox-sensing transcriptional repressor Rex [Spirochaetales bacterium]|nr:redox-sensing transcriptional repressor Rex [Spirochaetales bacterium]